MDKGVSRKTSLVFYVHKQYTQTFHVWIFLRPLYVKSNEECYGCCSMARYLHSVYKVLGLTPSIVRKKTKMLIRESKGNIYLLTAVCKADACPKGLNAKICLLWGDMCIHVGLGNFKLSRNFRKFLICSSQDWLFYIYRLLMIENK